MKICTTLRSLPQWWIVPILSPDHCFTGSASMGTSAFQFQHWTKNQSQCQHWTSPNKGSNIYTHWVAEGSALTTDVNKGMSNKWLSLGWKVGKILSCQNDDVLACSNDNVLAVKVRDWLWHNIFNGTFDCNNSSSLSVIYKQVFHKRDQELKP